MSFLKNKSICLSVIIVLLLLTTGASQYVSAQGRPYKVVSTVAMIGDVVQNIAGRRATVVTLIRTGVDPHLYNPTRSDVQHLQAGDVVFYVGSLLEGRMSRVLDSLGKRNAHIHSLIDFVAAHTTSYDLKRQFMNDPHIWMDSGLWKIAAEGIAEALIQYDPAGKAEYMAGVQRYTERLDELHAYTERVMATVSKPKRVLVTAHDAFAYFGRAYEVRVEGIQGISTESEAGLRRINDIIDLVVAHDIGVVFVESSVNDKNVRSLLEGGRARGHRLRIGGVLYSDAMGGSGSYEGTYIGMVDHNATTIAIALGGQAPQYGMQGKMSR